MDRGTHAVVEKREPQIICCSGQGSARCWHAWLHAVVLSETNDGLETRRASCQFRQHDACTPPPETAVFPYARVTGSDCVTFLF